MAAHVACRAYQHWDDTPSGCFVVCDQHGIRQSFGFNHPVAIAARNEHNAIHHPELQARRVRLLSVVYESSATADHRDLDLPALLGDARQRNRAFGVTGMLLAENGRYLQALEGTEPIVRNLMKAIRADPRHEHVRVLAEEIVQTRRFPDWAMALGHIGELEALPLAEYYEALLAARATPAV